MSAIPPYNTGKVQIGIRYDPPVRMSNDCDMNRLQGALSPGSRRLHGISTRESRQLMTESVLWTVSLILLVALVQAPSLFSFITN